MAPLIGITSYRHTNKFGYPIISLNEAYIQAVSQAGGIPVMIPLGLPEEQLEGMLAHLDGLVLSGGGDIAPERFGMESHPKVDGVDPDRDRVEIKVTRDAVQNGVPFLGICRGIQTLNVALGGTLYTHIPDQVPNAVHHPYIEGNSRGFLAHDVTVQSDSALAKILGDPNPMVNSMHHQGIFALAPGLVETAHAADGVIEAVELPDHPYGIAVQWHPECITELASMQALFRSLVVAATR